MKGFENSPVGLFGPFDDCKGSDDCLDAAYELEENFELRLVTHELFLPPVVGLCSFWVLVGGVDGSGDSLFSERCKSDERRGCVCCWLGAEPLVLP